MITSEGDRMKGVHRGFKGIITILTLKLGGELEAHGSLIPHNKNILHLFNFLS